MAFEYDISDEDILTEQKDAVNRMKEDDKWWKKNYLDTLK
jgi:hypothetical protein